MAAVTVSAQNFRLDDAEDNGGWISIGGGQAPSAEGSFPYQGGNLVNKKITNTGGVAYDPTQDAKLAVDMTLTANKTFLAKAIVSDYNGLNAVLGCSVRIGSSSNAYHETVVAGSSAVLSAYLKYAARDRFIIVPVNPAVIGYRSTSGSPDLSSASYFGFYVDFDSSTAKAENVGLDAIDFAEGLTLIGGDGVSIDGHYSEFISFDEGNSNNRIGLASSIYNGAVGIAFGNWKVGDGSTATEFTDNTSTIVWPDGFFDSGYSVATFDVPAGGSNQSTDGTKQTGLGDTTVVDSRPDYTVLNGAPHTHTGTLNNFRNVTYNPATISTDATINGVKTVIQDGASVTGLTVSNGDIGGAAVIRSAGGSYASGSVSNSDRGMDVTALISGPTNDRQVTIDGTLFENNTTDITLSDPNDVTVNLVNGATATTVENTGAGGASLSSPQILTLNISETDAILVIYDLDSGDPQNLGTELYRNDTASTTELFPYSGTKAGDTVQIKAIKPGFRVFSKTLTLSATGGDFPVDLEQETN